jgi:hypothetical protein
MVVSDRVAGHQVTLSENLTVRRGERARTPPDKPLKLTAAGFSQSCGFIRHGSW